MQHGKRTGVPRHLLLAPTAPAFPSTAHAMLSVFPGVCTALCRAGIQLMFPERAEGGKEMDIWSLGSAPLSPLSPSLACTSPTLPCFSPAVETYTSAQKSEKSADWLPGPTNQAGGTSPTSEDKGLRAGPERVEGRPCHKACAAETERGSRRERGEEKEIGSRREGDTEVGGGRSAQLRAHWSMAVNLDPVTRHFLIFFSYSVPLLFSR